MDDFENIGEPVLPYAGTSGWSGSDTSLARALKADANGETLRNQQAVLLALYKTGRRGLTWFEADTLLGFHHHGKTTGALSALHKKGNICRLTIERKGCKIYVYPEFTDHRATEPQGR